jgi:hypothetical protein
MPVTHMTLKSGPPPRKRPQAGDSKTDKDGNVWTRRSAVVRQHGKVIGYDCTNGRQRYVWVREGEVYP